MEAINLQFVSGTNPNNLAQMNRRSEDSYRGGAWLVDGKEVSWPV